MYHKENLAAIAGILEGFLTMLRFSIYLVRWIASAFVMMPFMMIFDYFKIPIYLNLILIQVIGACIFYFIDKRIFK